MKITEVKEWVYVITNPSMHGLVKIGYSSKHPLYKADELYTTGVPAYFEVYYCALVHDAYELEQRVHAILEDSNENKEWFRCSPGEAVAAIRSRDIP